ncbi:MAG: VWA domain-containing protein, partial [Acidobacteriales bacterium]|nr:VWA domain-containing protein [Terriglobales bacterium]
MLQTFDPKQPVAIYALGSTLHSLQDFTTDVTALREAAKKASTQAAALGAPEGDLIDHSGSDAMGADPNISDTIFNQMRSFEAESSAQQLDMRVMRTLDALDSIARRLQSVPGRKNLIWLSSSFPLDLYPDNDFSSTSVRHYADQLQATLMNLENSRIAVYPVDAEGLAIGPLSRADRNPTGMVRGGPGAMMNAQTEWSNQMLGAHDTMNLVAEKTGGRAFYNRNDLDKAIATAIHDGSTYYSLAFQPANTEADGRIHKVKITTSRKGVNLRYREAYFALNQNVPSKQRIQFMKQEMSDALTDTQNVATGVVFYAKLGEDKKSVDVLVDVNFLTYSTSDDGKVRFQFQLAQAVFDGKGKALSSGAEVVGNEFDSKYIPTARRVGAHFKTTFTTSPDAKRVRIAVRDLSSDRIGTVDVPIS